MAVEISATAPPATHSRPSSAGSNPSVLSRKTKQRAQDLTELGQLPAAGLVIFKQYADAGAVTKYWPSLSIEVAKLAEDNEKIADAIDKINEMGPYAALIAVLLPFGMQIAANHDKVPVVVQLGVVPKSVLEAQVKSDLLKQEIEARRALAEMEEQARQAQAEFAKLNADAGNHSA